MGDFNVESNSPVCEHLRESGYFSCFEVSPPENMSCRGKSSNSSSSSAVDLATTAAVSLTNSSGSGSSIGSHAEITSLTESERDIASPYGRGHARSSPAARFVSHRTHNHEDLGVDHIFIKPEPFSPTTTHLGDAPPQEVTGRETRGPRGEELFVDDSVVYPGSVCASNWFDEFYSISDHRPVGSKIIFGKRIR